MLTTLLVDDRSAVCEGLRKMIPWEQLDARVAGEARNGKDALELAARLRPDMIITDIKMPEMDGLSLSKEIHERMPETVIIILSAYDDFAYAQTAIRYNVTDYILKPIDRAKINQLIDRIAEISKKRKEATEFYSLLDNSALFGRLASAVKSGHGDDAAALFESAFPVRDFGSVELIRELCLKLYLVLHESLETIGLSPDPAMSKETARMKLIEYKTKDEMKRYLMTAYMNAVRLINEKKKSRNDVVLNQIKHYIRGNYMNPDLSVYTIADLMKLTPNYISAMFRQMTGENISVYITGLRMEKARELIKDPDNLIARIAKQIGYTDSHYFARVFKKSEGLTPSEYRNLLMKTENGDGRD